jgi:hypothetical protein
MPDFIRRSGRILSEGEVDQGERCWYTRLQRIEKPETTVRACPSKTIVDLSDPVYRLHGHPLGQAMAVWQEILYRRGQLSQRSLA